MPPRSSRIRKVLRAPAILLGLSFFSAAPEKEVKGEPQPPNGSAILETALAPFRKEAYAHATVAFALADGASGEILAESDAGRAVVPASVVKAITTGATLHHFSPGHRFRTTLECSGTTSPDGVLLGDLIIRGGGDPTLGSTRVDGALSSATLLDQWTSAVAAAGIRAVAGCVVGDASCFTADPVPDSWEWVDIGNGYGTGTSGLCFHDNYYWVSFRPGASVGDPAPIVRTDPPMPELRWVNEMRTGPAGSGDQGYIYGAPFSSIRAARGTIPQGDPEFAIKGSFPDPAATLARLLCDRLTSAGIAVAQGFRSAHNESCSTDTLLLSAIDSPPLGAIIHKLNKHSQNLYAETLLLHLARQTGDGSRDAGLSAVRNFLRALKVPLGGVALHGGSGLSRTDTVTARALVAFFHAMQREPHFAVWRDSLPVLGVDADLRRRAQGTPVAGKVHAKTGYLGGPPTRTLAGYLEGRSGRTYCFAFLVNHFGNSYTEVDRDVDAALLALFELL